MAEREVVGVLEEAMSSTAAVFSEISALLKEGETPNKAQLKSWKRLAAKGNKAIAKTARIFWSKEDRSRVENALLKQTLKSERLDRDANFARILEKLRSHSNISTTDLDRACGAAAQVQVVLSQLAPVPNTSFHGAAFLALSYNDASSVSLGLQADAPSSSNEVVPLQ